MIKKIFAIIVFFIVSAGLYAQVSVINLKVENLKNPLGIDVQKPVFSWQLESVGRNVIQRAYEIKVSKNAASLTNTKSLLWASGKVQSDQSLFVTYGGPALESGEKYFWQVRVWDDSGKGSEWSPVALWQMGLINKDDW